MLIAISSTTVRAVCHRPLLRFTRRISMNADPVTSPLCFISGQRVQPGVLTNDINVSEPATGKVLCQMSSATQTDVDKAVSEAHNTFSNSWGQMPAAERSKLLLKASQLVRKYSEALSRTEVLDTGKPLWEAQADVEGCADTIEYYAGLAQTLAGQHIDLGGSFAYTRREPLGVVGGIGAWNFPFQMACWKSAPALACGNTMVFKPSPLTPLTAVMLAEIYIEAGIPPGVFNVIQGEGETGSILCNHPKVAKMTFTGSVPTGSKVMDACAKGIKYVTLELGGKSPVIVFDDCDLENAVKGTMLANFLNQGQVCSNGTRVYVQRGIYDSFVDKLVLRTKAMKIGNPMQEDTRVGASISLEQFNKVINFLEEAKKEGAVALCGGTRHTPDDTSLSGGYYFSPCVLTNVTDNMRIAREEVFGSVACIFPFDSEEEVIKRANDTEFGLAGGVFTKDLRRAHRVAGQIQAGNIYINNYNIYPCQLPFGGYKKSGIGRESGTVTLEYYTQVKTVYVEMNDVDCPL